ncbi:MAG TPA: type IV toxin-antitoxin system AbiEi family antitoxin [Thermoleophilaceae bacterium]|jgi:predicted transcriptional regulator of viral defense system/very-short-patch-repair endonuclease
MAPVNVPTSVWKLAERDFNVVDYDELRARGYTDDAIRHRVRIGRLHRKARGVYSVGTPSLTRYGRWMVAVKACRPAVLSFLSAAVLWGIWKREPPEIHLTVPRNRRPRCTGVRLSRRDLPAEDVVKRHRLPVTSIVRTLIDLATVLGEGDLEQTVAEADAQDLIGLDVLRHRIEGRSEAGAARLRELLDRHALVIPASKLERLFLPLAEAAGLPKPQMQTQLGSSRVDFFFPDQNLVVECDSLRYHRTPLQQAEDAARDQAHFAAGRERVRFTFHQIARQGGHVKGVLSTRSARPAAGSPWPGRPSGSRPRSSP